MCITQSGKGLIVLLLTNRKFCCHTHNTAATTITTIINDFDKLSLASRYASVAYQSPPEAYMPFTFRIYYVRVCVPVKSGCTIYSQQSSIKFKQRYLKSNLNKLLQFTISIVFHCSAKRSDTPDMELIVRF